MSDHWIRLRGGWEWQLAGEAEPEPPPCRVTLPIVGPFPQSGRVQLTRVFQTPRFDPQAEALSLRLDDVPGMIAAVLNGNHVAGPLCGEGPALIPLGVDLPARNRLVLDVEIPAPLSLSRPWGSVALVIHGCQSDAAPAESEN